MDVSAMRISVLCVADPGSAPLVADRLEAVSERLSVRAMTDTRRALEYATGNDVDCVVSDHDLAGTDGLEFLEAVRAKRPDLPFVLFPTRGSEELASRAISAGVTDYLRNDGGAGRYGELATRVENAVENRRAEQEREAILDRMSDGFFALDEEWRFTYLNEEGRNVIYNAMGDGSRGTELVGRNIWEVVPELVGTTFEDKYREAMDRQEPVSFEEYYEPLDQWFEIRAHPSETGLSIYYRDVTDRKARQRRYEAVFDNTYQFTGLLEPDGTVLEANETALTFGGLKRDDVIGKPVWETHWFQASEETRAIARRGVEQARDGSLFREEVRVQGVDREAIIDFSIRPVTDERGEVTLLVPEGRDITELKDREEQLREERAFTESVFAALPDVFYAFDEDGTFLRWNDRFQSVTGYSDEDIAGMNPTDFFRPDDRKRISAGVQAVLEDGETVTVEARFLTKSGETTPYELTGARLTDEDGEVLGLVGIGRDLTDRKKRQRRFEAVFNNTYQFTGLMAPDGTLLEANETALSFAGIDREEVVGKPIWEAYWFQASEDTRETAREAVEHARDGSLFREEVRVQGRDREVTIDFSVRPVTDEDGEITLLIPEGRDITELKDRERHLQVLHRVLRHNLRNDLNVVQGFAEILTGELEGDLRDYADRIHDTASDLIELSQTAKELSDAALDPEEPRQPVTLEDVLESTVADVDDRYSPATLEVDALDGETVVSADRRLRAVFEELLENAVEHTGEEPTVTVTVGEDDGEYVPVEIADDGPGIPPAEWAVIEEGKELSQIEHGSGLGLWVVRWVVDSYGGDLEYRRRPEGGSLITVFLPLPTDG